MKLLKLKNLNFKFCCKYTTTTTINIKKILISNGVNYNIIEIKHSKQKYLIRLCHACIK